MINIKAVLLITVIVITLPLMAQTQADVSLKARGTGFYGRFGDSYAALGYESALTVTSKHNDFAFGAIYTKNLLAHDEAGQYGNSLAGKMNLVMFSGGAKKTVAKYFHPFAYVLFGFRFMSYANEAVSPEEPLFTSFSLGYGARTGLQIGGNKWRFEGSIDYLTGTKSKYVTGESFKRASETGQSYRDFAGRSPITGINIGVGIVRVFNWNKVSPE